MRDLPQCYGNFETARHRFTRRRGDGTFDRILKALQIRLDKQVEIDWDLRLVDGINVRASRAAAGAGKKSTDPTVSNPTTTTRATAAADGDQNSTRLLTGTASSSPSRSRPAERRNRRNSTT